MLILDLTAPPGLVEIDNLVQRGCNILHQDAHNAMLVIYPQKYSGQSAKANLTAARRIEDMLLKCNANIDCEVSLHFNIEGMHSNDKRNLGNRAQLVYSEALSDPSGDATSPFLAGAAARGKISEIPLLRIKEMKRLVQPGSVQDNVASWNLSPAERCQQKGPKAAMKIVDALLDGMPDIGPDYRLDLVELQVPNVPDWVEGAWMMRSTWQSDPKKPIVTYCGFCREVAVHKSIQGHLEATLMKEYWDSHPSAGPPEPLSSDPVEKPTLSLASWSGASPNFSDIVVSKFDGDSTYCEKWALLLGNFREFVVNTIDPLVQKHLGGSSTETSGQRSTGPDLTVDPKPEAISAVVMTATPKGDFKMDEVFPGLIYG